MEYFDFNPTMIEKWDRLARMDHPISGTHYYLQWLGHAKGYKAVVVSDFQLDDEVVAPRAGGGNPVVSRCPYDLRCSLLSCHCMKLRFAVITANSGVRRPPPST